MFGIIDENKKFILLDDNRDTLRSTALMLAKQTETGYVPMFTDETIDVAIAEYTDIDIEIAYNGDKYLKGYAPAIDNEYQQKMREKAYEEEVDPITAHISRLRDKEKTTENVAEINELIALRDTKVAEIKEKYPYSKE